MILIVVKYRVRPEAVDRFLDEVADFTAATRAEPGNLWFEWSRSVDREALRPAAHSSGRLVRGTRRVPRLPRTEHSEETGNHDPDRRQVQGQA